MTDKDQLPHNPRELPNGSSGECRPHSDMHKSMRQLCTHLICRSAVCKPIRVSLRAGCRVLIRARVIQKREPRSRLQRHHSRRAQMIERTKSLAFGAAIGGSSAHISYAVLRFANRYGYHFAPIAACSSEDGTYKKENRVPDYNVAIPSGADDRTHQKPRFWCCNWRSCKKQDSRSFCGL